MAGKWTRRSYDAIHAWSNPAMRSAARKIMIADGLDDVVARLEGAATMGTWYTITQEAVAAVGPRVVAAAARAAERALAPYDATRGARALRAIPSEVRAAASRANGAKGGRPRAAEKTLHVWAENTVMAGERTWPDHETDDVVTYTARTRQEWRDIRGIAREYATRADHYHQKVARTLLDWVRSDGPVSL